MISDYEFGRMLYDELKWSSIGILRGLAMDCLKKSDGNACMAIKGIRDAMAECTYQNSRDKSFLKRWNQYSNDVASIAERSDDWWKPTYINNEVPNKEEILEKVNGDGENRI